MQLKMDLFLTTDRSIGCKKHLLLFQLSEKGKKVYFYFLFEKA
jgi:hypothetical protein